MSTTTKPAWLTSTVVIWLGAALLLALAYPVAVSLDARLDRVRPMYDDRAHMEWLQYQSVVTTGRSVPVDLAAGESVNVAGETFTASAGVSVEVTADEPTQPCVRARNEHGDVTEWACLDPDSPPVDPDPVEPDPGVG